MINEITITLTKGGLWRSMEPGKVDPRFTEIVDYFEDLFGACNRSWTDNTITLEWDNEDLE